MSMLDLFLTDPTDPVERAQAVADIEQLRAMSSGCDCDRADPSEPHSSKCPALGDTTCPGCDGTGDCDECAGNGCMACNETGDCPECDGTGEVEES